VLIGVLGTALVLREWRGLLAFALLLTNYSIKAKKEERILAANFSDEFREHQHHAGFLLPRLHAKL
jgi:protein-S-isoprenylcysteine O-methyltransferase Ste14